MAKRELTEAERVMCAALAEQVAADRFTKTFALGPPNEEGRQEFVRIAPPTEAEQAWDRVHKELNGNA